MTINHAEARPATAVSSPVALLHHLQQAPTPIALLHGTNLVFSFASAGFQKAVDRTETELLGRPLYQVFPEQTGKGTFEAVLADGKAAQAPWPGHGACAAFAIHPIKNVDGFVTDLMLCGSADVSPTTEKKHEATERELYLITNALPLLISYIDRDYRYRFNNKAYEDWFGERSENLYGKRMEEVIGPEAFDQLKPYLDEAFAGRRSHFEMYLPYRSGPHRFVTADYVPHQKDGEVVGLYVMVNDLSGRRKAEEALLESEARLRTLTETLEEQVQQRTAQLTALADELQRSNEDLQQFAHVASHDLKEPVRKIRTFGSRLLAEFENELPAAAKEYLHKMEAASARIYSMIDGVLSYSSLSNLHGTAEPVDLNALLQDIQHDLELVTAQTGAQVRTTRLPVVHGVPVLLYQLFYNLLNNSLKFARTGTPPVVTVSAEESEGFVQITFADNGIGFAPEQAEAIFKTFIRLNPKDRFEGTGLGLSLCKKIAERHGGSITAEGRPGEGAVFTVSLPLKGNVDS